MEAGGGKRGGGGEKRGCTLSSEEKKKKLFLFFFDDLDLDFFLSLIFLSLCFSSLQKKTQNKHPGALSTVDRDYGPFLNTLHHHIADTHVLHHLFSAIPHYHAVEATEAIKPILGQYYARDGGRGVLRSVWGDFRECAVVAADEKEEREEGKRAPLWFRRLVE